MYDGAETQSHEYHVIRREGRRAKFATNHKHLRLYLGLNRIPETLAETPVHRHNAFRFDHRFGLGALPGNHPRCSGIYSGTNHDAAASYTHDTEHYGSDSVRRVGCSGFREARGQASGIHA